MTTIEEAPLDAAKLEQFVFRAVDEVGATVNAALVVMGDRLGLYRAMAGAGELSPAELRKVRDYERRHGNRKSVLEEIERKLG